jgi:hypothetical protein
MMNTKMTATRPHTQVCTCTNQHLLAPGSFCDICMGLVAESMPATVESVQEDTSRYDQQYFEALESYYIDVDFAA